MDNEEYRRELERHNLTVKAELLGYDSPEWATE